MSTPDAIPKDPVPEADKPFILALIGTAALVGVGGYGAVFGKWDDVKDFVGAIGPLVGMAWGMYFKSKS